MSFCDDINSGEPDSQNTCGKGFKKELAHESTPPSMHATCVMFDDGAYTKWHYHTGEQMLFATEGQGFVEFQYGLTREIREGEAVYIPVGVWHRHGAIEGKTLTHLAVTCGETRWDNEDPCQRDSQHRQSLGLTVLNEISQSNQRILQAEEAGSVEEIAPLLAERFTIVRASGEKMDRQAFLSAVPANANRGRGASQSEVHLVGECAVFTCVVTTTQTNPGHFWNTRLFIRENGQSLCAAWHVVRIPD